jgi:hypothetical protein
MWHRRRIAFVSIAVSCHLIVGSLVAFGADSLKGYWTGIADDHEVRELRIWAVFQDGSFHGLGTNKVRKAG